MKQCPKCNRTFPDENQKFCTVDGGLLISQPAFDPNATMRATSSDLVMPPDPSAAATSRELPNPAATVYDPSSARTAVLSRDTGPTNMRTIVDPPAPPPPPPVTPVAQENVSAQLPAAAAPEKKKSKLPLILGVLAVLLVLGVGGVAAAFFFVIKPRLDEMNRQREVVNQPTPETTNENTNATNANTSVAETTPEIPDYQPPAGAVKFANSLEGLEGPLADQYFDFSFYYPEGWKMDSKAARAAGSSTYAKVERMLPPDFTQENFAVGWYESKGTYDADKPNLPEIANKLSDALSKSYPDYRKVSEGPTKVSSMDAYEFRFEGVSKGTERGDVRYWGRVIFLPVGDSTKTTGARLSMFTTSLAPELSSVEDVGERGELPMVLESFRFGKK